MSTDDGGDLLRVAHFNCWLRIRSILLTLYRQPRALGESRTYPDPPVHCFWLWYGFLVRTLIRTTKKVLHCSVSHGSRNAAPQLNMGIRTSKVRSFVLQLTALLQAPPEPSCERYGFRAPLNPKPPDRGSSRAY